MLSTVASALLISLSGSIPLGNLNMSVMHLAGNRGVRPALHFCHGAVLVEMIYLRISLAFVAWIAGNQQIFYWIQWLSLVLFLVFALGNIIAAGKAKKSRLVSLLHTANPFKTGLLLSALNPMQFPFWAGWSIYLNHSGVLPDTAYGHNLFTLFAGVGTYIALMLFLFSGARLSAYMKAHATRIDRLTGLVFLVLALYQIWRLQTYHYI